MGLSEYIVEGSPDGIVVVSDDGEILGYNERFGDFRKVPESAMDSGDADGVTEAMSEKYLRRVVGQKIRSNSKTVLSQHSVPPGDEQEDSRPDTVLGTSQRPSKA